MSHQHFAHRRPELASNRRGATQARKGIYERIIDSDDARLFAGLAAVLVLALGLISVVYGISIPEFVCGPDSTPALSGSGAACAEAIPTNRRKDFFTLAGGIAMICALVVLYDTQIRKR